MNNTPPTIPEGWRESYLEDLVFLDREKLNEGTSATFSFYYIDISAVSEGNLQLPATKILFRGSPSRARKVVRRGDVLMATVRPNLKAFAYFDHTNDDCIASTGFAVLTAKPDVDPRFILSSILSDAIAAQIESHVVGSNYPAINSKDIRRLEILAPPPPEQRKIAWILTTLDNLIEKTESLIAKYQAIKQGMMHDLFTRGVDPHGHLRPSQAEAPHLYQQSELGWIPKEWSVVSAKELCHEITKGATPAQMYDEPGLSNVPFIRVQNLSFDGTLSFEDEQSFIPSSVHDTSLIRSRVFPGDVLMNLVGPPMGKVSLIPSTYSEWNINQAIAIFRPRDTSANEFLSHFLLSQIAFKWFISRAKRTSGQTNITLEMCRQLPVPIPHERQEQNRITDLLNNADTRLAVENAALNESIQIKTGFMQDLLTGKVRVKVDETEEVAHV